MYSKCVLYERNIGERREREREMLIEFMASGKFKNIFYTSHVMAECVYQHGALRRESSSQLTPKLIVYLKWKKKVLDNITTTHRTDRTFETGRRRDENFYCSRFFTILREREKSMWHGWMLEMLHLLGPGFLLSSRQQLTNRKQGTERMFDVSLVFFFGWSEAKMRCSNIKYRKIIHLGVDSLQNFFSSLSPCQNHFSALLETTHTVFF